MFVAVSFSVFLIILVIVVFSEQKVQKELREKTSQLEYQIYGLSNVISFLNNAVLNKKLTDKDRENIESLMVDIRTQYSNSEELTEMLEKIYRRLNNIEKEAENERETDPMFDEDFADLDIDDKY